MNYRLFDGYTMTFADTPSVDKNSMRFTGKRDSTGKDIFECDILTGKTSGVVEYDEFSGRFGVRSGRKLNELEDGSVYTIAGNALENPELV